MGGSQTFHPKWNRLFSKMEPVVFQALAKDPKDRHLNVKIFAEELEKACYDFHPAANERYKLCQKNKTSLIQVRHHDQCDPERRSSRKRRLLPSHSKSLDQMIPRPQTLLTNLADLYYRQHKYAEAEPLYQHAFKIYEHKLGNGHHDTVMALNNLAIVYKEQGKYTKAGHLYRRALAIYELKLGADHLDTATVLNDLGSLCHDQGNTTEAKTFLLRALRIREQKLGADHPLVAETLHTSGRSLP